MVAWTQLWPIEPQTIYRALHQVKVYIVQFNFLLHIPFWAVSRPEGCVCVSSRQEYSNIGMPCMFMRLLVGLIQTTLEELSYPFDFFFCQIYTLICTERQNKTVLLISYALCVMLDLKIIISVETIKLVWCMISWLPLLHSIEVNTYTHKQLTDLKPQKRKKVGRTTHGCL